MPRGFYRLRLHQPDIAGRSGCRRRRATGREIELAGCVSPRSGNPASRQEPEAARDCSTGGQPRSWWCGTGNRAPVGPPIRRTASAGDSAPGVTGRGQGRPEDRRLPGPAPRRPPLIPPPEQATTPDTRATRTPPHTSETTPGILVEIPEPTDRSLGGMACQGNNGGGKLCT